jgi:hypothetical protein
MSADPALPQRAKRFFLIWGGSAAVIFAFAGYLTFVIVDVNEALGRTQYLSIYPQGKAVNENAVSEDGGSSFKLFYSGKSAAEAWIRISLDRPAKILLNHVAGPKACQELGPLKIEPLEPVRTPDSTFVEDGYLIDIKDYPSLVDCTLKSIIVKSTFTARHVQFLNPPGKYYYEVSGNPFFKSPIWNFDDKPAKWTLDETVLEDAEQLSIIVRYNERQSGNNRMILDAVREAYPGEGLDLRWTSTSRESLRDILVVIIGAAVALGAAMFLEALRPYVERLVVRIPR